MALAAIAAPLLFIRGNMMAARYVDDVLQKSLYYRIDIDGRPQALFQQDNATPRITRRTTDFLQLKISQKFITTL